MKHSCRFLLVAGALLLCLSSTRLIAASTNWTFTTDLTLKEAFDSNVYLQDHEPNRAQVPQAVSPFQESFITSITPGLRLTYKPCQEFGATLSYAPELAVYHAECSENFVAQRGQVNLTGKVADVPWDFVNALTYVEGSDEGLYFGAPGGAPAIGGIPIRERRDQFMYRGKLKATWTMGKWFVRPVFCGYMHDFNTIQRTNAGYENYIDRSEVYVGADLGCEVAAGTRVFVGYRYGKEVQGDLIGSPYHYDATYNRPMGGIEGQPVKWLKLAVSVGADIHSTTGQQAPGFDSDYTTLWSDSVVTLLPTERDSVALAWRQNTQPAFASSSVYDDIVYDVTWRHAVDEHWSASSGFRAYGGDWMAPVKRNDWIYTITVGAAYVHDAHLSGELAYSYDWTESKVPNTSGREFTRNLVWLAAKYRF